MTGGKGEEGTRRTYDDFLSFVFHIGWVNSISDPGPLTTNVVEYLVRSGQPDPNTNMIADEDEQLTGD